MSRYARRPNGTQLHAAPSKQRQNLEEQAQIASYVAQLSGELAQLSHGAGLDLLAYFLNMAKAEGEAIALQAGPPKDKSLIP